MARPQSVRDLMHVPTPSVVTESLRSLLRIGPTSHVLDPCCGTGQALLELAPDAHRYGIELELKRAALASTRAKVLTCAMQDARVSHGAFGCMLLNPPYDDSTEGRLERVFLERCSKYLRRGGILILVVKQSLYGELARVLRRHYDVIGHWRFPDPYFSGPELAFGQTVLVARLRDESGLDRDPGAFWAELKINDLEPLPETFDDRIAVPAGWEPRVFISGALSPEDMATLCESSPVSRVMKVPSTLGCGRPPVALKQGHIAMVLASGLVNGVYGDGVTLHVAKGTVVREQKTEMASHETCTIETVTDSFAIKIRTMTQDGEIHEMAGSPAGATAENNDDDE